MTWLTLSQVKKINYDSPNKNWGLDTLVAHQTLPLVVHPL